MAEAVAAFGLAASVLQFIDFGLKIASNFKRFYKIETSKVGDIPNLRVINADLDTILKSVQNATTSSFDDGFCDLEQDVKDVGAGLQTILRSLAKTGEEKIRKRDALKSAFMLVWKEEEIKSFQTRLNRLKDKLTLQMLVSLRCVSSLTAST